MIKAVRTPVDSLDDLCLRLLTQIQKMNYIQAQSFKCCKSLVEFHLQGSILAHFITWPADFCGLAAKPEVSMPQGHRAWTLWAVLLGVARSKTKKQYPQPHAWLGLCILVPKPVLEGVLVNVLIVQHFETVRMWASTAFAMSLQESAMLEYRSSTRTNRKVLRSRFGSSIEEKKKCCCC